MSARLVTMVLVSVLAAPASAEPVRTVTRARTLDIAGAAAAGQAALTFLLPTRSDEVCTEAQLRLQFRKANLDHLRGLEVRMNAELVAVLTPAELAKTGDIQTIPIPPQDLADRNVLTLQLTTDAAPRTCGTVPARVWSFIQTAQVVTEGAPLPLPDDLSLLPLPFIDRAYDQEAVVPVVFATQPTRALLRSSGLLSSWLGVEAGLPFRFPVTVGALPSSRAVVFVTSPEDAARLGLPAPQGASVQLLDHPKFPGSNVKLLVFAGRTEPELELAVRNVAARATLNGDTVRFDHRPPLKASEPYDAPRWLPGGAIPVSSYPGHPTLTYEGTQPGAISVSFRIAPDTWPWPAEHVTLELGYRVNLPAGVPPPRLDVELNGRFLAGLPTPELRNGLRVGRVSLHVHAGQLSGFNELRLHVTYPDADACHGSSGKDPSVTIDSSSRLHLEGFGHLASLPDVSMFIHDGFPFTRVADLGDTAVVLPAHPNAGEVSTMLSFLAHFARITGTVGTRVTMLSPEDLLTQPKLDKDLLLVGLPDDLPALRRWGHRMPLSLSPSGASVQMPEQNQPLLRLLSGRSGRSEMNRARRVIGATDAFAAVVGWESPLEPNRSVVAITATSINQLPSTADLSGFADAKFASDDLLISAGSGRWMFSIGPSYTVGAVDAWTKLRWFLAMHWVALFPGTLLGALLLGAQIRRQLWRWAQERLPDTGSRS